MAMFKIVGAAAVGILVLAFGVGLLLPSEFRVQRSVEIDASPELVFGQVNSFRNWDAWSPWIHEDPSIRNTFSGSESGVGATVTWTSENSGEGVQRIRVSEPFTKIETDLDFGDMGKPHADWAFEPTASGVRVTWGLSGNAEGPVGGYFAMAMDGMVGGSYELGLKRLKAHCEKLATPNPGS